MTQKRLATEILENLSKIMEYELMVSSPGIREADSGFMWASNFKAPIGTIVTGQDVFFNLFLPEGSENDKGKKLFLNRVKAKFQDGLWQVSRDLKDLSTVYGEGLRLAVSSFSSIVLDYTYIKHGRYHAHFLFNENDRQGISDALLHYADLIEGFKVEELSKLNGSLDFLRDISEISSVSTISLDIFPQEKTSSQGAEGTFFAMQNFVDEGVKTIIDNERGTIPGILEPTNIDDSAGKTKSFKSQNKLVNRLMELIASEFIVTFGMYGYAMKDSFTVVIPIPTELSTPFLKVLGRLKDEFPAWNMKINELTKFMDTISD